MFAQEVSLMSRFTRQEIQALAVALDLPEETVCTTLCCVGNDMLCSGSVLGFRALLLGSLQCDTSPADHIQRKVIFTHPEEYPC